jgi:hypothetical protein
MNVEKLSAVVFTSPDPERLAAFYNEHLGLGFEVHTHGDGPAHHEAMIGDMRFAVVQGPPAAAGPTGVSPTFLVQSLDRFVEGFLANGVPCLGQVRSLGGTKRLGSFADVDGNPFHLIDLGLSAV